ncbi:MAG: hypothetical protein AB8G16_11950 [Gammaproteobacteria bacterium]
MNDNTLNREQLEDALTDYVRGTAGPNVCAQIETLAQSDTEFAALLTFERQLVAQMNGPQEYTPARAIEHDFQRLKARIEQEPAPQSLLERVRQWFASPANLAPFGVAAAMLVTFLMMQQTPVNQTFETLSRSSDTQTDQPLVRIIFDGQTTRRDATRIFEQLALVPVRGPDDLGSYVVTLENADNIATKIDALRAHEHVVFADQTTD